MGVLETVLNLNNRNEGRNFKLWCHACSDLEEQIVRRAKGEKCTICVRAQLKQRSANFACCGAQEHVEQGPTREEAGVEVAVEEMMGMREEEEEEVEAEEVEEVSQRSTPSLLNLLSRLFVAVCRSWRSTTSTRKNAAYLPAPSTGTFV